PAGFCPKCWYPMDPGQCPECGAVVGAARLSHQSRGQVRRRRWRRIIAAALVLILSSGAWLANHHAQWLIERTPTRWLLLLQGDENSRITRELVNRYEGSLLNTQETDRMFEHAAVVRLQA